ncbi:5-formyltetrahydrofolate cyclo-ligase [Oceanibacterium hippocampi]|uniref:5-formyltetrahydrofolate cyclo-ligase n=1 Tax=Oceanibacterium hippocampi TaxID=745714 RepID=A0A1Y5S036_9PROT|nr:5-formyltetrahydrofolate cyclo-ligase [Oceanibacterium hippocampi]SLN26899.1 putative 5-formyltetrahydrofolate cyclo-ligase [Oceanibacterium hippocampi]
MSVGDDDEGAGQFASPPCFMHETDPEWSALSAAAGSGQSADLKRWRKAERERLIAERMALTGDLRRRAGDRLMNNLDNAVGEVEGLTVSTYWPFRGEPNLHPFMKDLEDRGARCALPVVVAKGEPLIFRHWKTGDALDRGVWNIPIPKETAEVVIPDIVIAPVVGYDRACYRLGYGGGFYDRTLAAMRKRPRVIGVGFRLSAIPTIYPQWYDIPMDAVVTEVEIVSPVVPDEAP